MISLMNIKQKILLIIVIFIASCGNKGALYISVAQICVSGNSEQVEMQCKN